MKQYLSLVLGVMIVASPAFASRARLEALGEDKNGSYYIQDSRDMFLNPSQIVHYKKKLMLELGTDPVGTVANSTTYTTDMSGSATSRAQGGFINTFGDFTYALYLDQTSDRATYGVNNANTLAAGLGLGGNTFVAPDHQLELFFAGESSVNWGISVLYAANDQRANGVEKTAYVVGTRLGIESGNLQAFTTVGIASDSKVNTGTTNPDLKGKVSVDAAVTYGMDNWTWFGKFTTWGSDATFSSTQSIQNRNTSYGLGFGYKHEASKTITMYSRLEADYAKSSNEGTAGTPATKYWDVPVVMGAEAAALSWLTVRGSISHVLIGQQTGSSTDGSFRTNLSGTTTVAAGLGLTFGDVAIDGLVATDGTVNTNGNGFGAPGLGTGPNTNTGFGFGNNMLTRLALTYSF